MKKIELINRDNKDVIAYKEQVSRPTISFRDYKVIYFSYTASVEMNLSEDNFVHFYTDNGKWYVLANKEASGSSVRIAYEGRKHSGYFLFSTSVITTLLAKSPAKVKESYQIKKTKEFYEGTPVFEIIIK